MPPRSRYAVDPSLTAQAQAQYQQPEPSYPGPKQAPHFHQDQTASQPIGQHAAGSTYDQGSHGSQAQGQYGQPQFSGQQAQAGYETNHAAQHGQPAHPQQPQQPQQHAAPLHPSFTPPVDHIQQPPHSSGPSFAGPRVRIDPAQMPNPIEAQELDQNLWDDEDFMSCQTRGVIPLAGTNWRGVDQGNSLPRHLRATLPTIPTNSQLLDTTALPFGLIVQPFAQLRYDEAPIPLVSNFVSGQSAFDVPPQTDDAEGGPPRCDKCRGYINPWVRWQDGGRKWGCNLCGNANPGRSRAQAQRSRITDVWQLPTPTLLIWPITDKESIKIPDLNFSMAPLISLPLDHTGVASLHQPDPFSTLRLTRLPMLWLRQLQTCSRAFRPRWGKAHREVQVRNLDTRREKRRRNTLQGHIGNQNPWVGFSSSTSVGLAWARAW